MCQSDRRAGKRTDAAGSAIRLLGDESKLMPATLYAAIQNNLAALAREHVHPVLVLDEAHLIADSSLFTLRLLANFHWAPSRSSRSCLSACPFSTVASTGNYLPLTRTASSTRANRR